MQSTLQLSQIEVLGDGEEVLRRLSDAHTARHSSRIMRRNPISRQVLHNIRKQLRIPIEVDDLGRCFGNVVREECGGEIVGRVERDLKVGEGEGDTAGDDGAVLWERGDGGGRLRRWARS